jgi:nicotinate-nucleotide adenylyltransferase
MEVVPGKTGKRGEHTNRVGIYGGSFDPVHHAHVLLARDAVEQLQLDKLYLVPAARSPHKEDRIPAPAEVRYQMVCAAIEGEQKLLPSRIELDRPPPSYAIDTVLAFLEREGPGTEIFYLIGQDNLPALHTWHRYEELEKLVTFVILARPGCGPLPEGRFTLGRRLDLSATEIRNRIAKGLSVRYLVPDAVDVLIRRHQLYL